MGRPGKSSSSGGGAAKVGSRIDAFLGRICADFAILGIEEFFVTCHIFELPAFMAPKKKRDAEEHRLRALHPTTKKNAHRLRCTNVEQKRVAANTVI